MSDRLFGPLWRQKFIMQSNKLSFKEDGDRSGHWTALDLAITSGYKNKVLVSPMKMHETMCTSLYPCFSGSYRNYTLGYDTVVCDDVPVMMAGWMEISKEALMPTSFKTEPEAIKRIWQLHKDFLQIRPFVVENERVARLLMLNQCLYADVDEPNLETDSYMSMTI